MTATTSHSPNFQQKNGPPIAEKVLIHLVAQPPSQSDEGGDARRSATNSALVASILKSRFADKIPEYLKNVAPRPPAENVVMRTIHRRRSSAAMLSEATSAAAAANHGKQGSGSAMTKSEKEERRKSKDGKANSDHATGPGGPAPTPAAGDPRTTPPVSSPSKPLPLRMLLTMSLFASTFAAGVAAWSLVTTAGERNAILNGQVNAVALSYHISLFIARVLGQAEDAARQAAVGWRAGVFSPIGASRNNIFDVQASHLAGMLASQSSGWPGILGFSMAPDLAASTSSNAGNSAVHLGWGVRTSCQPPGALGNVTGELFDSPTVSKLRNPVLSCKTMDQWLYPRVGQLATSSSQATVVPLNYAFHATRFGQSILPASSQTPFEVPWPWPSFTTASQRTLVSSPSRSAPSTGGNWTQPYVFHNTLWMGFHMPHQGWHTVADVNLTALLPSAMSAAISLANRSGRVAPSDTKTYLLGTVANGADAAQVTGLLNLAADTKTLVLAASHLSIGSPVALTPAGISALGDSGLSVVSSAIASKSYNLTAPGIRLSTNGVWVRMTDSTGKFGPRGEPVQINLHGLLTSPANHIRLGGLESVLDLTLVTVIPEASFYPAEVAAFSGSGFAVLVLSVLLACTLGWVAGTRAGVILATMATRLAEFALTHDFERPVASLATANLSTLVQSGSIQKLNLAAVAGPPRVPSSSALALARSEESIGGPLPAASPPATAVASSPGPSHNGLNLSTPKDVWRGLWFAELHQVRRCVRELATCLAKGALELRTLGGGAGVEYGHGHPHVHHPKTGSVGNQKRITVVPVVASAKLEDGGGDGKGSGANTR